jgi:hypothetical protein
MKGGKVIVNSGGSNAFRETARDRVVLARSPSRPLVHGRLPVRPVRTAAVPKFDPKRDAANDINDAVKEAKRTGRRVILDVGGEWCGWCHTSTAILSSMTIFEPCAISTTSG